MIMKVGYPDKWKDLSSSKGCITIRMLTTAINARKWHFNYNISKYAKPVDRTEWGMQPQNYNRLLQSVEQRAGSSGLQHYCSGDISEKWPTMPFCMPLSADRLSGTK